MSGDEMGGEKEICMRAVLINEIDGGLCVYTEMSLAALVAGFI